MGKSIQEKVRRARTRLEKTLKFDVQLRWTEVSKLVNNAARMCVGFVVTIGGNEGRLSEPTVEGEENEVFRKDLEGWLKREMYPRCFVRMLRRLEDRAGEGFS